MHAKTILTVFGDNQEPATLDPAIEICRQNDLHLSVLIIGAAPPPPTVTYGGLSADLWVEATEAAQEKINACRETMESYLQNAGISGDVATVISPTSMIDDEIGKRARYADLALIASESQVENGIKDHLIANGVLFEAAKPLLLLRKGNGVLLKSKRIVLAWDASLEASKAAHESIGLMRKAEDVRVVLIDPEPISSGHGAEAGSDIATYLARHGITLSVDRVASAGRTIADCLLQYATDQSADLVVMGAYGHSRLRERVFGGTTESMLTQKDVAVLMMH